MEKIKKNYFQTTPRKKTPLDKRYISLEKNLRMKKHIKNT